MEEATWLSPIVVVPRKNGKPKVYVDIKKLNAATKKDPFPLPFINEVFKNSLTFEGRLNFHVDTHLLRPNGGMEEIFVVVLQVAC
jgi:hypothetical protein